MYKALVMRTLQNILVTGGCGFIGNNFIRMLLKENRDFSGRVINLDILTYAGNPASLVDIEKEFKGKRYFFERGDICDKQIVENIFRKYEIDTVVHFAAESHVDRSILNPLGFIQTNIIGTFNLLDVCLQSWKDISGNLKSNVLFHHTSTDEVYGSLGGNGFFTENTPYCPRSPYSASKASSDHLVMAYHHTYGLPVTLSNCSNNYGPYQFPEKLIPLMILNMVDGKPLPVYGDGKNIRDWVFVEDHNNAILAILQKGLPGERYNIGGDNEWENIKLLEVLIEIVAEKTHRNIDKLRQLIAYVKDRPGHDKRYAIDCSKIKSKLGWRQSVDFRQGLARTVDWYLNNSAWIDTVKSGEYKNWLEKNYILRGEK